MIAVVEELLDRIDPRKELYIGTVRRKMSTHAIATWVIRRHADGRPLPKKKTRRIKSTGIYYDVVTVYIRRADLRTYVSMGADAVDGQEATVIDMVVLGSDLRFDVILTELCQQLIGGDGE